MSTLQLDTVVPASHDESLDQHIRAQEYLLQRVEAELLNSRLAAAARSVRRAVPLVADVMLGIHPAGGRFSVLEARDHDGRTVDSRVRDAAEQSIASVHPGHLSAVIGTRIDIAKTAAWWPEN